MIPTNIITIYVGKELPVQVSVSAPIGTVENKRIVASYGFIYTLVNLIGVFFMRGQVFYLIWSYYRGNLKST